MTDVPQLFVRTQSHAGGRSQAGLAAEGLPPKWFTKNPATTFEQDLPEMLDGDRPRHDRGCRNRAHSRSTFFDLWRELDRQQTAWAAARGMAPLLAHLGVSLVERAVLDAPVPRARRAAASRAAPRIGSACDLGEIYPELGATPSRRAAAAVRRSARADVRHTVGLGDRADGRRRHARGARGRRAAAGSRVVHPRLRPALFQDQADRQGASVDLPRLRTARRAARARGGAPTGG